ncbi:helix-turn-helix domain-containing protein [Clostridium sp. KNHs205]|jgi:transposase|uniref:helix-turn-helix domain-containing protein n=1 Tax=Clostridium sp. KNHs205 TaxID=1449050 RepID=UPI00051B104C|nr:helix-turn-helix domain-containing protein [Clostridium sp. KNHs205]
MEMLVTELNRLEIILDSFQGKYTVKQAAEKLEVTERRVNQLRIAIRTQGCEAIQHTPTTVQNKDLISMWQLQNVHKKMSILKFQRMLEEQENIEISYSSVYRLLRKEKLFSPYHKDRQEKLQAGNVFGLVQPKYPWLPGIKKMYYLYILWDISGCITGIYLNEEKNFLCMKKVLEQTLDKFGIPETIYLQPHNILLNKKNTEGTEFYKSMNKLGILVNRIPWEYQSIVKAVSETLKYDVALLFQEKQVANEVEANELLYHYMHKVNARYEKKFDLAKSVFVPVIDKETIRKWMNN